MRVSGRRYLLVPAGGSGDGIGHLIRCLGLAGDLLGGRARGEPAPQVALLTSRIDSAPRKLLDQSGRNGARKAGPEVVKELREGRRWDLILLDARATPLEQLRRLQGRGPVICLDEGGEARQHASFLVDAIPRLREGGAANLSSLSFLSLPARARRKVRWPPRAVLVSFGGEDREGLSEAMLAVLLADGLFSPSQITVVEGPLFTPRRWPDGIAVLRNVTALSGSLASFDAVFTHFGLTALEAMAAGVPAILLNPGTYHARLSAQAEIPTVGTGRPDVRALRRLLGNGAKMQVRVDRFNEKIGPRREQRLAGLLKSLNARGTPRCPVCGREGNRVVARFPDRTYRACGGCGVTYLESFAASAMRYETRYFGAAYKAQYGRTYLADFPAIKAASRERLRIVRSLAAESLRGAVVDVGCAYGPFLSAAKDEGLAAFGIDVSAQAVQHVQRKLGIPALCSSFEEVTRHRLPGRISALTFWYVIEHFLDPDLVLRKAASFLPAGGILAFSTPNGRGISARKNRGDFLEKSPADHFTIFSPAGLGKLLSAYGFELQRIRVTGHHPERFPGLLGKIAARSRAGSRVLGAVSSVMGLGDTFEAYAVKAESR